ncbi:MAG: MotA/TolQ/ExbB proton channel family protein [Saprospirales bacterium]|nr:MotA/TolQ/ExbB proton channel family protein [Saprospirales bacterium]MBK8924065.1 MotA/TolQ/ExbB proton channel family protein [Saprospirales bacterium]
MFSQKNSQIALSLGLTLLVMLITTTGYQFAPNGSSLETFFFALGGKMPDGLIQAATFFCFFICLFGMNSLNNRIRKEEYAYTAKLLPETEQYVLYPEDVNQVKLNTIEVERHIGAGLLTDLIKQAATKFRSSHSPAESLAMVETVSDMHRKTVEKDFWLINTCQSLIPAFGFLGTVLGMAAAILNMGKTQPTAMATPTGSVESAPAPAAVNGADIQTLIDNLGTAFFTTIVAIVLGILVNVLMKRLESRVENLHTGMKRYVLENLVNRIQL